MAKQKISNSAIFLCFLLCACGPSKTNKCSHHVCIEKGVDATCLEPGMTEKKYCDICGEVFSDHEEIKPHGHNVVHIPELEAGIQYKGYKEWEYCDICGTVLVEKEETDRIVSKDEVFSKTYENTAYFTINLHKDNVPHTTDIIVEHSGLEERFHLNNSIQFEYPNMEANTLYRFVFDNRYEDGDFENLIDVTRYINTSDPSLPFVEIETANTEWPSSLGIKTLTMNFLEHKQKTTMFIVRLTYLIKTKPSSFLLMKAKMKSLQMLELSCVVTHRSIVKRRHIS